MTIYIIFLGTGCGNSQKPEKGYFVEAAIHHDTRYWVTYKGRNNEINTISVHKSKIITTIDGYTVWYDDNLNVRSPDKKVLSVNNDSAIKKSDFK